MSDTLRIALAQINPHVGQVEHNLALIREARAAAARQGAALVVTPELAIAGCPPEDLVREPAFIAACARAIDALGADTADGGPGLIVGAPWLDGERLRNAAFLLDGGRIVARRAKHELPDRGGLDDRRVFDAGPGAGPVVFRGFRLGLMIGEDWWLPEVPETLAESGAEVLLAIDALPWEQGKGERRIQRALNRVVETGLGFLRCGQVGGQDDLVFDGASFALNPDRRLALQMPDFTAATLTSEWRREGEVLVCAQQTLPPEPEADAQLYRALMLGLSDYVGKNGFPGVLLGLSGGIDSALTAAVAVDALGPARVRAVMMPSPYTSRESLEDGAACARLLGIACETITIDGTMQAFEAALAPAFAGRQRDITEENIQARARGLILMAISNKFGPLLLTTGNKSEVAVGYSTLYGDMCGGYSVLKDVYKTAVFRLSCWRNAHHPAGALGPAGPVMPERVITKPPSAELRPGQTDQDSLPSYETLDAILEGMIEGGRGVDELVAAGFERATVLRVARLVSRAEYKRRQAPPGVRVSTRAFARDRRYPITNGFTNLLA